MFASNPTGVDRKTDPASEVQLAACSRRHWRTPAAARSASAANVDRLATIDTVARTAAHATVGGKYLSHSVCSTASGSASTVSASTTRSTGVSGSRVRILCTVCCVPLSVTTIECCPTTTATRRDSGRGRAHDFRQSGTKNPSSGSRGADQLGMGGMNRSCMHIEAVMISIIPLAYLSCPTFALTHPNSRQL